MSANGAVENLLSGVREWWRARNELGSLDREELDVIAHDLGMTAGELQDLAARGPDAAHLLYDRMRALGVSETAVQHAAYGLMRDLQKTCACCNEKGVCEKDLRERPDDPRWKDYCPNAISLESLRRLKGRFPA